MDPMDIVGKSKEDALLPKATMTKIIKEMLPADVRVARDAQDLLIECCDKRTIAPEHVLKALQVLGFGEYGEEVYAAYEQHRYETIVADVKKMNGLVTDLQMFALKSLQIPLPGRHPPSPCLSNGSLNHGSKASSRTSLSSAESETTSNFNPVPINLMDAPVSDTFSSVRKSSSASSLQDPDGSNGSSSLSLWPTSKWSLKPDLLTPAAITSSIFDGLPKPLTGRRNKAAMD
ncbi:hypothetical protein DY000_02000356 [Brassica cretica]|uniref:Transcription factor CBF/NF-Y/archaeal histone domain-containing protein n=1 Tax=Brassica cretica TaxID=69181 RepID=A0ABQ7BZ61_BRACR|nr:hypothetical protein DY000_02000356 [Brassica cretica]